MTEAFDYLVEVWRAWPRLARGLIILGAGWLGAVVARAVVRGLLALLGFDKMADRIGLGEFLRKGNVAYRPAHLAGKIAYWIVFLGALLASSRAMDIGVVNQFADKLAASVPGLLAAALIVAVGLTLVSFIGNVVRTIARNAAAPNAELLVKAVRYLGGAAIALMAFDELGLGESLLSTLFVITFAATALGVALAFGIGSADLAKDAMKDLLNGLRERGRANRGTDLEG